MKSHTEVTNQQESIFFYYFCLMIDGSGSVSLTNGSGSGRPKYMWILRIRIRNTVYNGEIRPRKRPEMEFLNGIFSFFRHKIGFSQTRDYVWFSTLIFPFNYMFFTNRLADFLYVFLKAE
jgi:hypothetical protein